MKKNFLFALLIFITANLFAQTNSSYHYEIPVQLNDGLQTASLSEVGIDSTKIIELTDSIASGYFPNVHSLLILRHNKLVYENYFTGHDETISFVSDEREWTRRGSEGFANHPNDSLHDVRSISKSVVSACIGIAFAKGKIKNESVNIWNYFRGIQ